jgi:hypothetical protein
MAQMGVIVLDGSINAEAWAAKVKAETPKAVIGKTETTTQGVKYIVIDKDG